MKSAILCLWVVVLAAVGCMAEPGAPAPSVVEQAVETCDVGIEVPEGAPEMGDEGRNCYCSGTFMCCDYYDTDGYWLRTSCSASSRCACEYKGCDFILGACVCA